MSGSEPATPLVVPYDPTWAKLFRAERAVLERELALWLEGGIHHIGSTSVPGLAAKPIVDMVAGVHDLEEAHGAFEPLERLGWVWHPHRPEAHAFFKRDGERETHHLHLTEPDSDLWRERLAFRDALRADASLREEYAAWKARHAGSDGYTADKRPLVLRVLADSGIDLKPNEQRLDPRARR
jgi:GrpB-like predicted nucleotidyltransferase (UPF0157 family)